MKSKNLKYVIFALFLSGCNNEKPSWAEEAYIQAQEYMEQGDIEKALTFYNITISSPTPKDSLTIWWKALCRQGEIYLKTYRLQDAEKDFSTVLTFALKHNLDTAEYIAQRKLGYISFQNGLYSKSLSYLEQARQIASKHKIEGGLKQGQSQEYTLASAACILQTANLPDSIYKQLHALTQDSNTTWKAEALKMLALQEQKANSSKYVALALQFRDSLKNNDIAEYSLHMEREKIIWEGEFYNIKRQQQTTIIIILISFAFFICIGVYFILQNHRKHKLDRIQLILNQKEQTIHFLETKQENSEKLLSQLKEKEERMAELERRTQKLNEIQRLLGYKKEDTEKVIRQLEDLNTLKDQIQQKEKEWKTTEQQLRNRLLYHMEIGRNLPTADNPNKPTPKEYTNLIATEEKKILFLKEIDYCFNNFASGLQKITPNLTMHDVVHCCLFRLGIRTSDIAAMCSLANSTISCRRKRLETKMEAKT